MTIDPAVIQHAIDFFEDGRGDGIDCSDLHHYMFNEDYFIIGYYQARKWLENGPGVFEAIQTVQDYEKTNFGEVTTDLGDEEKVANMFAYIQGEELLNSLDAYREYEDEILDEDMCDEFLTELKQLQC